MLACWPHHIEVCRWDRHFQNGYDKESHKVKIGPFVYVFLVLLSVIHKCLIPKKNNAFVNFNQNVNFLSIFIWNAHFSAFRQFPMAIIKSHCRSEMSAEYHIGLLLASPTQQFTFSLEPEFSFTESKIKSFTLAGRVVSVIQIMH